MPRQQGGLIARLLNEGMQQGGAKGDGYAGHRVRGRKNAAALVNSSSDWREEVADLYQGGTNGMTYGEALHEASVARKEADATYKTVAERKRAALKGMRFGCKVRETDAQCGTRRKAKEPAHRPRRSRRRISEAGAARLLRESYRNRMANDEFGDYGERGRRATAGMRRDISVASKVLRQPCRTKEINVTAYRNTKTGKMVKAHTRHVVDPSDTSDKCRDSWLYRHALRRSDMTGVDDGQGSKGKYYPTRRLRRASRK